MGPNSNGITFEDPETTIVENAVVNRAVLETLPGEGETALDYRPGVEIETVTTPEYDPSTQQTPLVTINDEFSTNLLIGADGADSQIRKSFGYEKFIEEVNFSLQEGLKYLNEVSSYHLPSSTGSKSPLRPPVIEGLVGKRASFPLSANANSVTKPRCILIGDAGHRVHPLAGQGLNMGLRDVRNLEESILNGWYCGSDVGVDTTVLNSYNFNQAVDNVPIGVGGHALAKIFSTDLPPVVAARNIGMSVLDNLGPIKSLVADFAKK